MVINKTRYLSPSSYARIRNFFFFFGSYTYRLQNEWKPANELRDIADNVPPIGPAKYFLISRVTERQVGLTARGLFYTTVHPFALFTLLWKHIKMRIHFPLSHIFSGLVHSLHGFLTDPWPRTVSPCPTPHIPGTCPSRELCILYNLMKSCKLLLTNIDRKIDII